MNLHIADLSISFFASQLHYSLTIRHWMQQITSVIDKDALAILSDVQNSLEDEAKEKLPEVPVSVISKRPSINLKDDILNSGQVLLES